MKTPLYYTFGNHMHWADMEWLWGYHVLPGSVRDMLSFCRESGAKGQVNFDAVGYEKMAAEAPDALAELREAIRQGILEVSGASYGQPYGLFQGGEANVRQRVYGVRSVLRTLGVRPRTFWEEEFDFFPQLPQMLRGVGMEYASLFFQWTWHTPHIPPETLPAVWWVGQDGSRLLTAPRGPLNLHQWPEDFQALLDSDLPRELTTPGIVQWLELMPSPDWMCRAELMLPQLEALKRREDYELRFCTLSEYLEVARPHAQERPYTLSDVFHGMSLGKNGDLFRRLSRQAEQSLLAAEAISVLGGLLGRPYPGWDVYPTWELEEGWRELLAAQHHDNDECEGLCGHVGRLSYERSLGLSAQALERTARHLARRTPGAPGRVVAFNPLGWPRDAALRHPESGRTALIREVPAFGYRVIEESEWEAARPSVEVTENPGGFVLRRGSLEVRVDRRGLITQIRSEPFPEGLLGEPLGELEMTVEGQPERFDQEVHARLEGETVVLERVGGRGHRIRFTVRLAPELDAVDLSYQSDHLPRPDGGVQAALRTPVGVGFTDYRLIHDHPYGLSEIRPQGRYLRKYPTGDWMTSPQVFEEVEAPFTALQLLDFDAGERGLLYLHDGSQAVGWERGRAWQVLSLYDPWDEEYFVGRLEAHMRLIPHGPLSHQDRWRRAQEFTRPAFAVLAGGPGGDGPARLSAAECRGATLTALYRETEEAGWGLERYAGAGIGYPLILRVVEFEGRETVAGLRLPGPVAGAWRTNLLGEPEEKLEVASFRGDSGGEAEEHGEIHLPLRPYEIATLYLDLIPARKQARDLDAHRSVWATVHREHG